MESGWKIKLFKIRKLSGESGLYCFLKLRGDSGMYYFLKLCGGTGIKLPAAA